MSAAVALGALVAAAVLAGSAAAPGPAAECRATLERLRGHDEVELAAMCRATFAPGVCREAKRSLGAQPWSRESMEAACGQWVAASPSEEVRRVLDTAKGHRLDKGITDKFLLPVVPMDCTTTAKPLVALAAAVPSASAPAPQKGADALGHFFAPAAPKKDEAPKGFLGGLFQAASTTQLGLWAKLKALKEKQEEPTTTPAAGGPLANLFKAITEKHEETTAAPPGLFAKWANAAKEKPEEQPATAASGPLAKSPKASSEKPSHAGPPAPTIPAVQKGAAQVAAAAPTAAVAAVAIEGKQGQAETPMPNAPAGKQNAAAAAAGAATAVEQKQSPAGTPATAAAVKKDAAPATAGTATAVEEKQGPARVPAAATASVKKDAAPATAGVATAIEEKQGHAGVPAPATAAVKKDAAPATAGAAVATVADATTAVPTTPAAKAAPTTAAPTAAASTMQAHRLLLLPGTGSVGTQQKFEESASKTMTSTWQGAVFVSAALGGMALTSLSAALVFRRGARGAQVPIDVEQPLTDALVE